MALAARLDLEKQPNQMWDQEYRTTKCGWNQIVVNEWA